MSVIFDIGRRIERLYYIGIVILAACLVGAIVAAAADDTFRKIRLGWIEKEIELIEQNYGRLTALYANKDKQQGDTNKTLFREFFWSEKPIAELLEQIKDYEQAIALIARRSLPEESRGGWAEIGLAAGLDLRSHNGPEALLRELKEERTKFLTSVRLNVLGIEIPQLIPIKIEEARLEIPLDLLSRVLAIVLGFTVLAWLMAVHVTRTRELSLLVKHEDVLNMFPHMFNPLPFRSMVEGVEKKVSVLVRFEVYLIMLARLMFVALFLFCMTTSCCYTIFIVYYKLTSSWLVNAIASLSVVVLALIALVLLVKEIAFALKNERYAALPFAPSSQ